MPSQNQASNEQGSGSDSDPLQVLVPEDMKWLMYHGLLSTDASNSSAGFIRGDRQALRDDFICSSYSNRRVFCEVDVPETINIPMYVFSSATFEYLGLSADAAANCWDRHTSAVADIGPIVDGATAFIACMKDYLRTRRERLEQPAREDGHFVMREIGCSEELIEAIMTPDPESKAIRERESALYWVLDTLDLRWKALRSLMTNSRERARQFEDDGWVPLNGEWSLFTGGRVPASKAPPKLVDHVQLWKGVDEDSIEDLVVYDGTIYRTECLLTCSPNDFNMTGEGFYFATDKSVAVAHANWIQRRSAASSGVIISLQVPESMINGLEKAELGHSDEDDTWAKFVWSCRSRANGFKRLPHAVELIADELEKKQLIVGHMSGCSPREILEMESYKNVTKEHLFCMPHSGMVGMQYFFSGGQDTWFDRRRKDKLVICERTA